ncbi:hypothetical protein N8I77_012466 [Diaporthe amygdali]|uniref:Uncharacterized protein n=1 Tax=Phomopsis amygdali TaxID=1214568 RepID=A0AAD9S2V4_PHOAM|nr:uncharacterized protein J7T55_014021 [Diaporthe amygdali]KAJ0119816.1 hypothetical protein J7T55_014021 [Diaporthe amygdali]KAK2597698.1 hypothetical protein N8I77_012466 [Diaporthe amygdali]
MAQKTTNLIISAIDDFIDELGFSPCNVPSSPVPLPLNISKRRDPSRHSGGISFTRSDSMSSVSSNQSISSTASSPNLTFSD